MKNKFDQLWIGSLFIVAFLIAIMFQQCVTLAIEKPYSDLLKKSENLFLKGNVEKALELVDEYINSHQNEKLENALALKGMYLRSLDQYREAIIQFQKVIKINPNSVSARLYLADIYYENMEEYDLALFEINKILELEPNNINAVVLKTYCYLSRGELKQVNDIVKKYSEIHRDNNYFKEFVVEISDIIESSYNQIGNNSPENEVHYEFKSS